VQELYHECGLAMVRLRKPLEYYYQKYGTALWGLHRLYILLGKQHNRGQDGAGIACVKLGVPPGEPYVAYDKVIQPSPPWSVLIEKIEHSYEKILKKFPEVQFDTKLLKEVFPYAGELLMGHLRYATHGSMNLENCHPVVRLNGWKTRTLVLAGNFNLTNVDFLFNKLVALGQYPLNKSDTFMMLERMGHFLDSLNEHLFRNFKSQGYTKKEISELIARDLDLIEWIRRAAKHWDGGYLIGGMLGHGDWFALRDPWGIRPGYYYYDDECVLVASERSAIATALQIAQSQVHEILPAHAILVKSDGPVIVTPYTEPLNHKSCSFERIYFSRGTDEDIYQERKKLGSFLVPQVLEAIDYDLENTVFSYIPNTAHIAFRGLVDGLQLYLKNLQVEYITNRQLSQDAVQALLHRRVRVEHVIEKDTKLRTFIADPKHRNAMTAHVYDVSAGTIRKGIDTLVCVDDSIVRGTTLNENILKNLERLHPKKIIIVSSAPQIRYPDCYGIDMSQLNHFVAFKAAIQLLKANGLFVLIENTYQQCLKLKNNHQMSAYNAVKAIYEPFSEEEISLEIANSLNHQIPVAIIYQTMDNLTKALPNHQGFWYFNAFSPPVR